MDDLTLAADFPQASREQWLKLVEGVLKGADFQKKLVGRTHDGLDIQPLYPKAEGAARVARACDNPEWSFVPYGELQKNNPALFKP